MNSIGHDIMNVDEIARWLRIPKTTLYKLCSDGRIPCAKIGKHWRFDRESVEFWFRNKVNEARK